VKKQMEKAQKEYYLNEKMKAIQKELGRKDEKGNEVEELKKKIDQSKMPEEVEEKAIQELKRLESMPPMSAEATVSRNYLDWLIAVPWFKKTKESRDLKRAEEILNEDHYGLEKIKERILEFLAVRALIKKPKATILTFSGPPGVGKTSLAKSIARAMNRKFVRLSLGGVRDEAEIRGHRRTYVGALQGRIVRAISEAGSMNPVVLLDEVDTVGADYRGDPTAALLEVLDPEQNHTFRDHYLVVELDLSDVLFLASANVVEAIPGPLLDRMELVELDGYTEHEKVTIARDHLLPRQLDKAGMDASEVSFGDDALRLLAAEYTREAGVRSLDRSIARVLRKVAANVALEKATLPISIGAADLKDYLGRPRFTPEVELSRNERRTGVPGVATGLAVTGAGGDVLYIEASLADKETGDTGVTLTGQLGDVMKESARIALSYLRSRGAELELPVGDLKDRGVHVHVPAGAIPKDGPSAGITMTTALASLLSGRPVRADVAMTGEVSLTGRVLPIGGLKQKLLAASRLGITTAIVPKRNEPDLEDVPAEVLENMTVFTVSDVREVLDLALEPATTAVAA
jgi:ATP-dependent Lon protease